MRALRFAGMLALCTTAAAARGEDAFDTDRPDVTESSKTVGFGRAQLETGVLIERQLTITARHQLSTPMLFRLGFTDALELRFETRGSVWNRTDVIAYERLAPFESVATLMNVVGTDPDRSPGFGFPYRSGIDPRQGIPVGRPLEQSWGLSNLRVGGKWHVTDEHRGVRLVPSTCIMVELDLPGGVLSARRRAFAPVLRGVADWSLPLDMTLSVMPGIILDTEDLATAGPIGILTASLSRTWSEHVATFGEIAAERFRFNRESDDLVSVNGGVLLRAFGAIQLDTAVRVGVSDGEGYFAQTAGVSLKL